MRRIDVFNGDADGLCALHQIRLAEPAETELVTGPKRRIELLAEVDAAAGDDLTVLDLSLDRNREALARLLARGARVRWFDHHYAGAIPSHSLLDAHIDASPTTCTSMLVDRHVKGRFRAWAVVAAFGDALPDAAHALADSLGLDVASRETLRSLGEDLNYNAYGETEADLLVPPATLYREMRGFADPFDFDRGAAVVRALRGARGADMRIALAVPPYRVGARGDIEGVISERDIIRALAEMGAVVLPPMPAFYNRPKELDDIVNHTIARVLDRLDVPQSLVGEWQGTRRRAQAGPPGV